MLVAIEAVVKASVIKPEPLSSVILYNVLACLVPKLNVSGSLTQNTGFVILTQVSQSLNFADDTAAATGGVPLGGLYRNGNFIMIRLT